jgi:predicted nucleic-acid-binding Zn-ribbon protein
MTEANDSIKMKKCPTCLTSDIRILVDNNDPDFIIVYCNRCGYKKEFKKLWIPTSIDFNSENKIDESSNISENTLPENNAPLCKCNCGGKVSWSKQRKKWNDYIHGHSPRTLGPKIKKLILH